MRIDKYGTLYITGDDTRVFDGDFNKLLGGYLAPFVYTKDVPEFVRLKNEYNAKVKSGEIKEVAGGHKPYYNLDYIEIEECRSCSSEGCAECENSGWNVHQKYQYMSKACKCNKCTSACMNRAGWFLPDEIKKAADHLGLSEKEFFDKYLGVDWFVAMPDIFVLAPATTSMETGNEYPANPVGRCIFFNDEGLCDIHPVKPYECKEYYHNDELYETGKRHRFVSEMWKDKQDYIELLLGREPESEEFI